MESNPSSETSAGLSGTARAAFKDLELLGYDVEALLRRNMNDNQIVELRDKALRFRSIENPIPSMKGMEELVDLFSLGVDLSIRSSPDEGKTLARHILYLAERELSDS